MDVELPSRRGPIRLPCRAAIANSTTSMGVVSWPTRSRIRAFTKDCGFLRPLPLDLSSPGMLDFAAARVTVGAASALADRVCGCSANKVVFG